MVKAPSPVPKVKDINTLKHVKKTSQYDVNSLTYFTRGRSDIAQIMALTPPITSSREGVPLWGGQIPFRTYNGEVPMSE